MLLLSAFAPFSAAMAEYPERPIRLVVPFPPGGVTDVVARLMADRWQAQRALSRRCAGAGRPGGGGQVQAKLDNYTTAAPRSSPTGG
jgi:tripartite-type tricarboxylate transporter receptor subunit TctC